MTTWALLFLAVLLDTPGLSSSEHYDRAPSDPCDGDPSCQDLIQEDLQDELLTKSEGLRIACSICKKIIHKLETMVGEQPTEDTIAQAASRVCRWTWVLKKPCSYLVKKYLSRISQDIMEGKNAHDICVDLKTCKPQAGGDCTIFEFAIRIE